MSLVKFAKKGIKEIKNNWRKEEWWRFRLPSLFVRALYLLQKNNGGIYVLKEDWDNLIILDACSYELFEKTYKSGSCDFLKNGKLEKKISRGSHTWMFLKENFKDGFFPDTIYITENPFIWDLKDNFFKTVYIDSVLPEILTEYALRVNENFPRKRLIIHYIQPHHPFIGKTRTEEADAKGLNPYYLFAQGKISEAYLRQAYEDNLKRALPSVEKLLRNLKGKTVISADHGEAFGAKIPFIPFIKIYAHSGPRIKELVEIPWLTLEPSQRKEISKAGKEKPVIIYEDEIREQLQSFENL
jgi:hypothetical protein